MERTCSTKGGEECLYDGWDSQKEREVETPRHGLDNDIKLDNNRDRMVWYVLDRSDSGCRPEDASCQHSNEPLCCIIYWEIFE
jgi:hypothetical protein